MEYYFKGIKLEYNLNYFIIIDFKQPKEKSCIEKSRYLDWSDQQKESRAAQWNHNTIEYNWKIWKLIS
jgi:hypothetical protein